MLTMDAADPDRRPRAEEVVAATAGLRLTDGARLTFEPGGQVELSSRAHADAGAAIAATTLDVRALRACLDAHGIAVAAVGMDPTRPPARIVATPRYDAMEAYFERAGDAGLAMMCSTASIQVNVDLGDAGALGARWRRAHAIGPVLVAAFANSPLAGGRITGARSTRQRVWAAVDPTRSAPVATSPGPADAWARYALAARVMLVRGEDGSFHAVHDDLPFARWMAEGHELGYPTADDFAYHLTTLFPPVRPKGWLELRMLDAVPDPWWQVAVAVTTALLDDAEAADIADRACRSVAGCWAEAASHGLGDPRLATAAKTCFVAALDALPRMGVDGETLGAGETFVEHYVERGRCPGDDLLDAWTLAPASRS